MEKSKIIKIGGIINKIRVLQGWNMTSPADTEPVARVWLEQLDRFNISPELYDKLLSKAIDKRLHCLREGIHVIPLTVELMLHVYEEYIEKAKEEYREIYPNEGLRQCFQSINNPTKKPEQDEEYYKANLLQEAEYRLHKKFENADVAISSIRKTYNGRVAKAKEFWSSLNVLEPEPEVRNWYEMR